LVGIEWAAGKISSAYFKGGHFPLLVVDAQNYILRIRRLVNVDLAKFHAALFQKLLGAAAI
jgi:hypothetical protein